MKEHINKFYESFESYDIINILNLGAGKTKPINLPFRSYNLVNLDPIYWHVDPIKEIMKNVYMPSINCINGKYITKEFFTDIEANIFMERAQIDFDMITIYRYLEHIPFTDVEYFIYLVSKTISKGGLVDVIVPNYKMLADMILTYDDDMINSKSFNEHNIILTTELLNEKNDPHCSIWTSARIKYFWELENKFEVVKINKNYSFDGRKSIYLRALVKRI